MHGSIKEIAKLGVKTTKEKSFQKYLFVGFSTVFIDLLTLILFREKLKGGIFSAVTISYWLSVVYNFLMNRHWSFKAGHGVAPRQMFHYGILLACNYVVTLLIISVLEAAEISEYIGKVTALCITISWTYFIYKKVIFKV